MVQLFTACPSTITVHAPHNEVSQPTCVPVRFSTSRMYCTSSRRGSTSFWCVTPFTVTLIVFFMEPPLCAAWELLDARHTKCFARELPHCHCHRAPPALGVASGLALRLRVSRVGPSNV